MVIFNFKSAVFRCRGAIAEKVLGMGLNIGYIEYMQNIFGLLSRGFVIILKCLFAEEYTGDAR